MTDNRRQLPFGTRAVDCEVCHATRSMTRTREFVSDPHYYIHHCRECGGNKVQIPKYSKTATIVAPTGFSVNEAMDVIADNVRKDRYPKLSFDIQENTIHISNGNFSHPNHLQIRVDEAAREKYLEDNKHKAAQHIYDMIDTVYVESDDKHPIYYSWRKHGFQLTGVSEETESMVDDASEWMDRAARSIGSMFSGNIGFYNEDRKLCIHIDKAAASQKTWGVDIYELESLVANIAGSFNDEDTEYGLPVMAEDRSVLIAFETELKRITEATPLAIDRIFEHMVPVLAEYGFALEEARADGEHGRWKEYHLVPKT